MTLSPPMSFVIAARTFSVVTTLTFFGAAFAGVIASAARMNEQNDGAHGDSRFSD